jgi:class I fructose-bisphosphate aldolase
MGDLGKQIRLHRLFSHPSGRFVGVAVDHFVGYADTMTAGLGDLKHVIDTVVTARPDALTMYHGAARHYWPQHAGVIPLIIQIGCFTPDDRVVEGLGTPEEVVRLGAEAVAVAIGVRGPTEGKFLNMLSRTVVEAEKCGLPVIAHIYPREYANTVTIVHDAPNVAWAVRCGIECGADVIKVGYPGSVADFRDIIATSSVPIFGAGGPLSLTLDKSLAEAEGMVAAGVSGLIVGRNIWGSGNPRVAVQAFKSVVHDSESADKALCIARMSGDADAV